MNDCEHCICRFDCKLRYCLTENSICDNEFHVPEEYDKHVREQVVDEFVTEMKKLYPLFENPYIVTVNPQVNDDLDRVAEQMKGEAE